MGLVLVAGAVLKCSHGGQIRVTAGDPKLSVAGNGAVVLGMEAGLKFGSAQKPVPEMVTPCAAQTPSTPPVSAPCVTAAALAGAAVKLTVGGKPVLLDSAKGPTVSGAGPGTWSVFSAGQAKLEAI